jgi:cellulose synthase (UDP-forming)
VQLDIDHVPRRDYLHKTLGHFRDKRVAWVQAPSIYGNMQYWTARGAAEQDMGMQGPLQMGLFGKGNTPLIIGSHCTYRTAAIAAIGGFQPTRAEDHLDTLALVANGWRGVFVPKAIALGDGPETLPAFLSQQYAWARSMFQILVGAGHRHLRKMPLHLRARFLFFESWYPLCAGTFLILFLVPVLSAFFDANPVQLDFGQLVLHLAPFVGAMILVVCVSWSLMQPTGLRLSWRGVLLHLVRWPIVLLAIGGVIMRRQKPYQVTPKGKFLDNVPTVKLYRPFIILGLLSALAALYASLREYTTEVGGQEFFAVYAAVTMLSVCVIDLNIRLRQTNLHLMDVRKQWLKPLVVLVVATGVITSIAVYALVMPFGARVVVPVISQAQWTRAQTDSVVQSTTGLTY